MSLDVNSDVGMKFGRYFLFGEVSGGQNIEVWVAGEQTRAGERRSCVIKRVNPRYADFVALRKLIQREVEITASVIHPGLIKVLAHGEIEGLPYICLEFVDGVAISQLGRLISSPAFPLSPLLELGQRLADALSYAHCYETPIIHSRLSPSNVLLSREGAVKIADLGLASAATDQASASLIPNATQLGYLAPEQLKASALTPLVDVFALGVILIELASGRRLFSEGVGVVKDQAALVQRICGQSAFTALPQSLTELLVAMTDFDAAKRPGSLQEVAKELRAISLFGADGDSIAAYLNRDVFVQLPRLGAMPHSESGVDTERDEPVASVAASETVVPSGNIKDALLSPARAPSVPVGSAPSFPTTAALMLNDVVYDQTVEFEAIPRLPSLAMSPLVPETPLDPEAPSVAPLSVAPPTMPAEAKAALEPGTYRLHDQGLDFLLQYDPYLRAVKLTEAQVKEAKNPDEWEYYYKFGDDIGPRIVRKNLTSKTYLEQEIILLEGSQLDAHSMTQVLKDAVFLPRGAVTTRGESTVMDMNDQKAEEMLLSTHESRRPRPSMRPPSEADIKDRLLRFFGQSG